MSIKLLLTGGTIDKHYNESNGELDFVDSHIQEILQLGRNHAEIQIQSLMLKDSLEMQAADRLVVLKACLNASQNKILITHGTDTMVDTAKVLAEKNLDKTIVIVGAMVPFIFKHSDAVFNLGFALASVQTFSAGVYITVNGKIFTWDNVVKNKTLCAFEVLKSN